MEIKIIDRLLKTLDVAIEAFAICRVGQGKRLVVPGGAEIQVHYILRGALHLTVPGGPSIICGPGSVVVVPPFTNQIIGADPGPGEEIIEIASDAPAPDGLLRFDATTGDEAGLCYVCGKITANISGSFGLLDTVRRPICEDLSDLPLIKLSYEQMLAELDRPALGSRALNSSLMKACLLMLIRRHFGRGEHEASLLSTLRDPRLGKAVTMVLDRPADRHSLAALASAAGMSRSAFAREFSQAFAMSPMAFVAKTRMHHAAEMLRSTTMPVKVIAASIGFSSRSHFSRAFRDAYGADPSAYRRAAGGSTDASLPTTKRPNGAKRGAFAGGHAAQVSA